MLLREPCLPKGCVHCWDPPPHSTGPAHPSRLSYEMAAGLKLLGSLSALSLPGQSPIDLPPHYPCHFPTLKPWGWDRIDSTCGPGLST